jgi:two-component system sensor histidine kinase AlgZ
MSHTAPAPEGFLPRFCDLQAVFFVVLLAALLAMLLVLAPGAERSFEALGLTALLVEWIALCCALALCLLRPILVRLPDSAAALLAWAAVIAVTLLLTAAGLWLGARHQMNLVRPGIPAAEWLLRAGLIAALVSGLALRYLYVLHQWRLKERLEAETRVQALAARMRPHFLFNSLNTIAALAHKSAERTEAAVEDLAELLRASLRQNSARVPLAEELALTRRYLDMEKLRLGERLHVDWDIGPGIEACVAPPLSVQPLVENAVYHGIEARADGGRIEIRAWREQDTANLSIRNPLPGADDITQRRGNQMALANIRERLALSFGPEAALQAGQDDTHYTITLRIPQP